MEGGSEAVTLLRYGPRTVRKPNVQTSQKKQEKFPFRLRRRSRSAPRTRQDRKSSEENEKPITYKANGERLTNSDSPLDKKNPQVQLVGFSLSPLRDDLSPEKVTDHLSNSFEQPNNTIRSRTLSRTSQDIKMERERIRKETMSKNNPEVNKNMFESQKQSGDESDRGSSSLLPRTFLGSSMAEERARFFDEARQKYHLSAASNHLNHASQLNPLMQQFIRENQERFCSLVSAGGGPRQSSGLNGLSGGAALAFSSGGGGDSGSGNSSLSSRHQQTPSQTSQVSGGRRVIPVDVNGDLGSHERNEEVKEAVRERVIPIQVTGGIKERVVNGEPAEKVNQVNETVNNDSVVNGSVESEERVIPVVVERNGESGKLKDESATNIQGPMFQPGTNSHRWNNNHVAFSRLGGESMAERNLSLLGLSRNGLKDTFPGFPNFGNFPSFTPLIMSTDRQNINHPTCISFKKNHITNNPTNIGGKLKVSKSKSTSGYAEKYNQPFRYVSRDEDHYGNSESESDSDTEHHELDILRPSIHSNDSKRQSGSSDTHSQDSGISGQGLHSGDQGGSSDSQAKRPISAVPSEISDISVDSEDLIRLKKVYEIANELLTTEITYVSKLHLIDQVFHFRVDQENRAQNMFPQEVVTTIFSNIKSIYKFHADFLLPQLKERMERWHDGEKYQRIGDIIGKNAPYLKMYTEYVKNFDNAMGAINTWYNKNSKFANIMDSIHSLPESGSLTLQHHMLSPIQRIPRYEMLLKEYLKKLPQDSQDRADSEKALQQVSLAATHANDAMNRIEQFKKLLEIQESIGGEVDLVSPTREVIKQGKIVKISARSGDHQERYLFLFSDLLLLCSPRRNMMNAGPQYALRAKFEVDNMQVLEGDNLVTANTFYVRDDHKSVELYTHIREEKEDWLESLFQTIKQLYQKKSSLRVGREMLRPSETEIGKKQPYLQKMENVLKCMECTVQFSILKHKHHCKSCGAVVCAKCSDYKHPLAWEDNRKSRVCKSCNNILKCSDQEALTPPPPQDYLPVRPKGLLEVSANTPGVHSGWLALRPPRGNAAKAAKRFFLLLPDFVLYSFRTEADTSALTATPLPGFTVLMGTDIKGDNNVPDKEKDRIIKLAHSSSKKLYYFAGTSAEEVDRWGEMLRMAARAEIPSECSHLVSDTQSTSSTEYENM